MTLRTATAQPSAPEQGIFPPDPFASPLCQAAFAGDVGAIRAELAGPDPEGGAPPSDRLFAMTAAAGAGRLEALGYLLDLAPLEPWEAETFLPGALSRAAGNGHAQAVRLLLARGAKLDAKPTGNQLTVGEALALEAYRNGDADTFAALLEGRRPSA